MASLGVGGWGGERHVCHPKLHECGATFNLCGAGLCSCVYCSTNLSIAKKGM